MENKFFKIISLSFLGLMLANTTKAVCPICVVAVGAGFELSRMLGVDDLVSSLWIGAVLSAVSLWTIDWLKRKKWNFAFYKTVTWLVYYVLALAPFYLNRKILWGAFFGTIIFLGAVWLNNYLKKKNGDKVYFPYQKVVIPFGILIIFSFIFYFLLSWKII